MDLLIRNARQLVTVASPGGGAKRGAEMREIGLIENGAVGIEEGRIVYAGPDAGIAPGGAAETIDASGMTVMPGFVDAHTHLIFAGSREEEFVRRIGGASYAEIAAAGGGINSTVRATRAATKEELVELGLRRLDTALEFGTTTIEIKSGYGLDEETEIRMLEAALECGAQHVVEVVTTFLGAHTVPFDYAGRREAYIDLVLRMIPVVAERELAEFCDVFCEKNVFSVEESRRILTAAKEHGLKPKLHADQLTPLGGTALAASLGAVSADHLDHADDASIAALREAGTVAVLLPGVSLFLGEPMPGARRLIEAGLPVAVATDCNPGSCMSENLQLMASLAAMQMRMTPEEAISAVTINAAAALGRAERIGSIEPGKQADILIFDIPNYRTLPYHFGVNLLTTVIKKGRVVLEKSYDTA